MENAIAYIIVIGVFIMAVIGIVMMIRSYRKHMTLDAEHKAEVEQWLKRERDKMTYKNKPAFKVAASSPRREEPKKKDESTTTSTSNDGFTDGLFVGMMVNALVDTITHKSESSSKSSWGLDDSDSRKSISDSMDTSSSWSSSDSSSSSDSGPSSDW